MRNKMLNGLLAVVFGGSLSLLGVSASADDNAVAELQLKWAEATYQMMGEERIEALTELSEGAREACPENCGDASLLIWKAIIVSSLAGEKGGLGALGLAKEAKESLENALNIDPRAMQGSAYTSLGTLFHKVPGWPIGFGNDKKARTLLGKALEINPQGIDANYFMGEFLLDEGEYEQAREHLLRAQQAPSRPNRAMADSGRQEEIAVLLSQVNAKIGS